MTEKALIEAITTSLRINDVPSLPKERIIEHIGRSNFINIKNAIPGDYPDYDDAAKRCFKTFQRIFPNDFLEYFKEIEGVRNALEVLCGRYKLGVITGLTRREAFTILDHFRLSRFFQVILTLDDYVVPRPAPDCVLTALNKLGLGAGECIYVGDTNDDVKAGKAAGVKTVAVLSGVQPKELLKKENPDFMIKSIKSIFSIL